MFDVSDLMVESYARDSEDKGIEICVEQLSIAALSHTYSGKEPVMKAVKIRFPRFLHYGTTIVIGME